MAEQPPRKRVTKAVEESRARDVAEGVPARVMKVLYLDDAGEPVGEWSSQQLPEDPFQGMSGIMEPPLPLEQLVFLAESHPVHGSALEQKTADVVGRGWGWEAPEDEDRTDPDEGLRDELDAWFDSLAPDDESMRELVSAVMLDYFTTGWGMFEVARDIKGEVQRAYHVPSHTVRAHRDGFRLCQIRDNRKSWFRRWGAVDASGQEIQVDAKTGSKTAVRSPANDLFVIRKPSRRSSWYGIPGYVSCIGWITLSLAARDDNLLFFANRREPRWAIILTNLQDDPDIEEDLRRAFTVDLKQPHRNILVPISGPGKVEFQKLSDNQKEGSFDKLDERASKQIMIAHRVPAERLANSQTGPLGGNATMAASRIYKEAVVGPEQEMLSSRLNRFVAVETGKIKTTKRTRALKTLLRKAAEDEGRESSRQPVKMPWELVMEPLDVQSDMEDLTLVIEKFKNNLVTLREARKEMKLGPLMEPPQRDREDAELTPMGVPAQEPDYDADPDEWTESELNDKLYSEITKGGGGGEGGPNPFGAPQLPGGIEAEELLLARGEVLALSEDVRTLLRDSSAITEQLEEIQMAAARDDDTS